MKLTCQKLGRLTAMAGVALFICFAPVTASHASTARPNVIFILADDLGYGELGCYGQQHIRTPHIDQLATEGVRFTQAYAGASVCAPSRCSLMTGRHGGHTHVRGNRQLSPEGQEPMPSDTFTVAHLMKRAGYATGIIGKWGLGPPSSHSTPGRMGFDYFFGYNCQLLAHEYYPEHLWRNDQKVMLNGKAYSHDLLADDALEFVKRNQDRPFFLYLAFTIPHAKLQVPDLGPYGGESWPDNLKKLAAMITRMDRDVGRLMALLKELNLDERTLVIFTSDNGAAHRSALFNNSGPLRGYKRDLYEGGIRVPAIARWPGRVKAGTVSGQVWAFWDFLPTMAELTGQKPPAGVDGVSILPALLEAMIVDRPPLYFEFHKQWIFVQPSVKEFDENGFAQAARIGDWKAIRLGGAGQPIELYDLKADPGETRNVAAQHPEVVNQFAEYLKTARVNSEAFPIRNHAAKSGPGTAK